MWDMGDGVGGAQDSGLGTGWLAVPFGGIGSPGGWGGGVGGKAPSLKCSVFSRRHLDEEL